jgi:signal transduction histidine kinase
MKKEEIIFEEEEEAILVIVNDITELIQAEQLKAQNKSKDLLLATTSHELRTPLNSINGMHNLLEDHVDEEGKEFLKVAESSTKLMLSLVNDLLDFSQIIAGKFRLNLDEFDFRSTLENIESIIGCLAEKKGLTINVNYSTNAPIMINSDEQRIMQVILNLMSNAIKFTTEGSISVTVEPVYIEGLDER